MQGGKSDNGWSTDFPEAKMAIITSGDDQTIRQWATVCPQSQITLHLSQGEGLAGDKLARFCDEFQSLVPQAQINHAPDEPFRKPALIIGRHKNIAYQALPLDKELRPFLDVLGAPPEDGPSPMARLELPAELMLFISRQCPHCPLAVMKLLALADQNPLLRLTIIDGFLFEKQAEAFGIRSVPTLIMDNELRWTGTLNMSEVIRQCARRDPSKLSAASLRQIIEAGEAERVASMMSDANHIFPAFIELLIHERWPVRLGAMVTTEYLADESTDLANRLITLLWKRFADLEESVQTDMVQVLAQPENEVAKKYLKKIVSGNYAPLVKEAASEELAEWSNR